MASDLERLLEIERLIGMGEDRSVPVDDRLKKLLKRLRSYRDKLSKKIEDRGSGRERSGSNTEHLARAREVQAEQRRTATNLKDQFYEIFKDKYARHHNGAAYQVQSHDFVCLMKCIKTQMAEALDFSEDTWRAACQHYFASPFRSYTLAYLAVHYGEFYTSARDRYGIPEAINGKSTAPQSRSAANVTNITEGLARFGIGAQRPIEAAGDSGDSGEKPVGLLTPGTGTR